jgi:glutamyl-tRNA synthetase
MMMPAAELLELFKPLLTAHGIDANAYSDEYITRAIDMVKGRANFVNDLWDQAAFFFKAPESYAEKDIKKRWKAETPELMNQLITVLEGLTDFASAAAEPIVLGWITDNGYHMGNVMNAFRLAVVGECKGPHMFDITELIGRDETIARLRKAIANITPAE